MLKPPSDVIQSPAGTSRALAASVLSTSGIERAFSMRVSWPGLRPSRMMWSWLSMIPGTTVRPCRLMVRAQPSSSSPRRWPTAANRPFVIRTEDTMESFLSIVWIFPLTSLRLPPALQSSSSSAQAGAAVMHAASAAAPSHARRGLKFMFPPLQPVRLYRPSQEKKWGSGKVSRAHGPELPVAIVRGRGRAGDEHEIGDLAVDPVPLAVEERAPCALAVLHRAPAAVGVQRDARAIGLRKHQPGARVRNGLAPFIELAHESRLDGDKSRLAAFRKTILDGIDKSLVDGAREPRHARNALRGAQAPGLRPFAVDFREVMADVGVFLRRGVERVAPRHDRIAHEMIGKNDRDVAGLLEVERLQRRDRTLPGLAPERRIAGHAVFSHGHLRGSETDQQPVRKQT